MRILIKRVTTREYNIDTIGQFKNGIEFKILDRISFGIDKMVGEEIECLLLAKLFRFPKAAELKPTFPLLEGTYIGEYDIPDKWKIGSLFELDPNWDEYTYHGIKTDLGVFVIRSTNLNHYDVKVGELFKFRVIDFELMAWESIEGEKEIDPLTYEKRMIEKFWNLMETTRSQCNRDAKLQRELIYKELLKWTYDEIWLFGSIITFLEINLSNKKEMQLLFRSSVDRWSDFCSGVIALGKKAVTDIEFDLPEFHHDMMDKKYADTPQDIVSSLLIIQDVVEEKSGKPIQVVERNCLSENIDYRKKMIYRLLSDEFKIDWYTP